MRQTWTWHFDLPPERLWPVLADTNRFNEAMGLPPYALEETPQPNGTVLRRGRGKAAGFTLLEIVVALAVFGFLLVGLSQTVRFGLTAWRQDARLSDGKTDLEAVDRSLRTVIENLDPGEDAGLPAITGSADEMTGVTLSRVPGSDLRPVPIEAGLAVLVEVHDEQ